MRNCETNTDRPLTTGHANAALVLLAAAVFGNAGSAVRADEIDAADKLHAQKVAITVCGTCHGPQGNNIQPKFPLLAGQNANYLAAQLKAFRSQARGDPDAIGYMWGMAAELDFQAIVDLVGDKLREVFKTGDIGIRWYDAKTGLIHYLYEVEHGARLSIPPRAPMAGGPFSRMQKTRLPDFRTNFCRAWRARTTARAASAISATTARRAGPGAARGRSRICW